MKIFALLFALLLSITISKADGWRDGEKQIIVTLNSVEETTGIAQLKISYDVIAENKVRAYVVPVELAQIEQMGLSYEIEVEDCNDPVQTFLLKDVAYHSYQEIIDLADSLELNFPGICKKYVFGTSLGGRQLAALKISDNVEVDENEAEILFDGGIHGDEICGPENIIRFARDICIAYDNDTLVTNLIDNRETWLYLMVNPDGRDAVPRVRYNNNGVDLNRDWGYMWDGEGYSTGPWSQVESKALRNCMYHNQFVVHTAYHGGTEYIAMPWSYRSDQPADWAQIFQLGEIYSSVSGYANLNFGQGNSGMYPINGSTKDSNYGIMGSITWSMEISYEKQPPPEDLMMYYNRNYPSMLAMIEYGGYGLDGIVTDANTGDPIQAVIFVNDYYPIFTDPVVGDYHKYVLPGTYSITAFANGYQSTTIDGITVSENMATSTNFELQPDNGHFVYRFTSAQIQNNNDKDEGLTPAVIGAPDNINYSIGKYGWCVLDMQYPIVDIPGYDIIIYEGDATPEIYSCYVGETIDGPWVNVGAGNGTSVFDISGTGFSEIQFIRLLDAGNGNSNEADAGFDLDAIEAIETEVFLSMFDYSINDISGNNDGKIDPGEFVDLVVTLKSNGYLTAENIEGEISSSSQYIYMLDDTASFGDISQGQIATGSFNIVAHPNTPQGIPVKISLDVNSNDGSYQKSFTMNFVVGQAPIAIIDLDMNQNSASKIKSTLDEIGVYSDRMTEFPVNTAVYSTIFVCLGIYDDNYVLNYIEGQMLADFLNNGGNLYMEGGETWFYDDQTTVHPMFNINGELDGFNNLDTLNGQLGTFTEGMSLGYDGDNTLIDQISPIAPAILILENQSPVYGTGVAYDAETYKTIGVSHEFGGLIDGNLPSTKKELMQSYLEFFEVELPLNAEFIASVNELCEQETIDFTDLSTGNILSREWVFEGGTPDTISLPNPIVVYLNDGVFDVTLTISDGVETSIMMLEDYIIVKPIAEIPAIPDGPDYVNSFPGDISYYTTVSLDSADTFTWNLEPENAGTITQDGFECFIDWEDYWIGEAILKVSATNECGESEFSEGLHIFCYMSNIDHQKKENVFIIPNPSKGSFSINFGATQTGSPSVKIIDNLGNQIYQAKNLLIENKMLQVRLEDIEPGIYYLILKTDKEFITEKIILK